MPDPDDTTTDPTNDSQVEGRAAGAATPGTPEATTTTAAAETTTTDSNGPAPVAADAAAQADDRDRRVFELLEGGTDAKDARTQARSTTPSADEPRGEPDTPEASSERGSAGRAAPPAQYGTLDEGSYHALNRTGMLPTPGEWQEMPSHARGRLVSSAKALIKSRNDLYQREQAAQQQQASRQTTQPAAAAATTTSQPTSHAQQQQEDAGAAGVGAGTADSARQAQPAANNGADLEALFAPLVDYFGGDDTLAQPLKQAFVQQQQHYQAAITQIEAARMTETAVAAFDELASEIPALADEPERLAVLPLALSLYQQQQASGQQLVSFRKCVVDAARAKFLPNLQQQAQRNLLERRTATVKGSATRVGPNANTQRVKSDDEIEQAKWAALERGEDPKQVRFAAR